MLNMSLAIVDEAPPSVPTRQDISKSSATAPVELSPRLVLVQLVRKRSRYAHKHVVGRAGIVLNTNPESNSSEGGSGAPESSQLGG